MAYSSSVAFKGVFGNVRVAVLSCTADAAAGNVSGGGVGYLFYSGIDAISMNSGAPHVRINVLESGTAAVGSVGLSGMTSGDVFYLLNFGRS